MASLTNNEHEPQLPAAYDYLFFKQLESLRDKAAELANQGADEGCLLWSMDQSSARARLNKSWICNVGDLHCSIILKPDFDANEFYQMLIVAIVSLGNAIASYLSPMTALGYQWPNDICIAKHKIASVWLDKGESNGTSWLTITLSVNVLNAPEALEINAISIREAQGTTELNNKLLLEAFSREFIKQINNWSDRGYAYIYDQWRIRLQNLDQTVVLQQGNEFITGTLKYIDEFGNIEVSNNNQLRKISIQSYMGLE